MSVIKITWQNLFDANDRGELVQHLPVLIGRSADCHLQPNDRVGGVSRTHARLDLDERGIIITDLNSKNGTWLNGLEIECAPVENGDQLQIGAWEMTIFAQIKCGNPECHRDLDHDETICRWCGQFTTDAVTREFRLA